jgi:hypothetical protein
MAPPGDALAGSEAPPPVNGSLETGISDPGFPETSSPDGESVLAGSLDAGMLDGDCIGGDPSPNQARFGSPLPDESCDAPRREVALASMLMLGASASQRIEGMGLARKALETPATGDPRHDLSADERSTLANARAWCLLVHGDLGHQNRLDDPFVLADANRHIEMARAIARVSPFIETTVGLLRLRQARTAEALVCAQRAIEAFARIPDHDRTGRTQGGSILALATLALVAASSGDMHGAGVLGTVARAVRMPLDLDDAAFAALLAEIEARIAHPA